MAVPFPTPAVIAHRGASRDAPEHTWAAYDLAVTQGADVLELDVRPLADGRLAVVHDATLARTCGDPRAVADLLPADLDLLEDQEHRPLLLDDVLVRYAGGDVGFLVELKSPTDADLAAVVAAIDRAGARPDAVVQSFDLTSLRTLARLDPDLPRCALLPRGMPRRLLLPALGRMAAWAAAIAPEAATVNAAVVARAHAAGLRVHPYTVNDAAELDRLLGLGVDGVITDVPARALQAMAGPLAA